MSTRSRQKLSSILALVSILALLLLLVFVWTAVRNGAFYENGRNIDASQRSHRFHSINLSETTSTPTPAGATTETTSNRNHSRHHHGHHAHHPHHRHHLSGKCQVRFYLYFLGNCCAFESQTTKFLPIRLIPIKFPNMGLAECRVWNICYFWVDSSISLSQIEAKNEQMNE